MAVLDDQRGVAGALGVKNSDIAHVEKPQARKCSLGDAMRCLLQNLLLSITKRNKRRPHCLGLRWTSNPKRYSIAWNVTERAE